MSGTAAGPGESPDERRAEHDAGWEHHLEGSHSPGAPADGPGVIPAPPTVRDRPAAPTAGWVPAPPTVRDPSPAPATRRDAAPAAQGWQGAPATVRDPNGASGWAAPPAAAVAPGGTPSTGGARARVNLPASLEADFAVERDLGHGGEADLLLVRRRSDQTRWVVRRYRTAGARLRPEVQDLLGRADRRHLIGLLAWGEDPDATWEILEYAERGSLQELRASAPGPWPENFVEEVLDQLTAALAYAHGQGLVHRDVKPPNILVRSVQPLDLVLTDFGLTRLLMASKVAATTSSTSAYAAPEAGAGTLSHKLDWWSLGIVVVELLAGINPYQRPDGTWLSDRQIAAELLTRLPNLERVTDPRWRTLCRGLLTRDPDHRWGAGEIARWRRGEDVEVYTDPDATGAAGAAGGGRGATAPAAGPPLRLAGRVVRNRDELAAALHADWNGALRVLAGRNALAPQYQSLREWIVRAELTDVAQALDLGGSPNRTLVRILRVLEPNAPAAYRGHSIEPSALAQLAAQAGRGGPPAALLDEMFNEGILGQFEGLPGCDAYGWVDSAWHDLDEAMGGQLPPQIKGRLTPDEIRTVRPALLLATLEPGVLSGPAAQAANDPEALEQPWFRQLVHIRPRVELAPAHEQALILARGHAVEMTQRARQQQWEQAQRAQLEAAQRRRGDLDRASPAIAAVAALIGLGPVAVYFSIRGRRVTAGGCLSNIVLLVGIIECIGIFAALTSL